MSPAYTGSERRRTRHNGTDQVTNDDLDEALALHAEQDRAYVAALYAKAMEAFPDGPEQHRLAHEQMSKAAKAEETFWRDLKSEIAKKSIFGIAQILLILVAAGVTAKFGITLFGWGK